jgi:hypothetical protein
MDLAYGASMVEGFKGALQSQMEGLADEVAEGDTDGVMGVVEGFEGVWVAVGDMILASGEGAAVSWAVFFFLGPWGTPLSFLGAHSLFCTGSAAPKLAVTVLMGSAAFRFVLRLGAASTIVLLSVSDSAAQSFPVPLLPHPHPVHRH